MHAMMVVYDGQFFRGTITATIELRDGRTTTEQLPNGPGGQPGVAPSIPSLATRLRSDEITLNGMQGQVARAERTHGRQRAKLLHGAPLSMLAQGLREIRAIVANEKARIGYERAHPGVLPAPSAGIPSDLELRPGAQYRRRMASHPRVVWMPGGVRTEIHLAGAETRGAFCLLVDHPPAGWSLPRHRHANEAETIHVAAGEFEIELDGTATRVCAGETIHVPRRVLHATANVGEQTGRRILLFSPAGLERFFLEAGSSTPKRSPDPAAAFAAATRHGWEFPARS